MKKNKAMYTLQQDVKIPDIVETKASQTFARIQREARTGNEKIIVYDKKIRSPKKKYAVLAMTAVLAVGTVSVYAAYINWSQGLKEELQITQEQQESLQENGMAAFADASVTDAGITVSALQSITDNYYTYLSFKVEGYHLEDGKQPDFENVFVTVDGKEDFNSGSSFSQWDHCRK